MKRLCTTCNGKGSIPDPKCNGIIMGYNGPNGETLPHVFCETCCGSGWVYDIEYYENNRVKGKEDWAL